MKKNYCDELVLTCKGGFIKQFSLKTLFLLLAMVMGMQLSVKAFAEKVDLKVDRPLVVEKIRSAIKYEVKLTSFQANRITGKVTDSLGNPLIGVTVQVKGSKVGTTTDARGYYEVDATEGDILMFSYVGYKAKEVLVKGYNNINIILKPVSSSLDQVVVVGYGTQKKENLTGAVSTIDAKELDSRPLTNLGQGLQGEMPGLNITMPNGHPGTGASFNIRGITSINGGGPLILVDGVQMDPNQINPADVKSVTVLKDAASAAIYGGRAAYGVILITTKEGEKNTPLTINYSYDYTMTRPTRLPTPVSSLEYLKMYRYADKTGAETGGATGSRRFTDLDVEKAKEYIENPIPINSVYIDPADPSSYRYVSNTNWLKAQYPGWAPQQQHTVSLTGGGEKTSYRASFGSFDQKGTYKPAKSDFKRYNMDLNFKSDVAKWLEVNAKVTINHEQNDQPANTPVANISPERFGYDEVSLFPIHTPNGHFTNVVFNPFQNIASGGRYKYSSNDIWVTGGFNLKPVKNLKIIGDYTWNPYLFHDKNNTVPYLDYGPPKDPADIEDPDKATLLGVDGLSTPSSVRESNSNDIYKALNVRAEYENTFNKVHYFKAMVGYNQEEKHNESFNAYAKDLLNPDYPYLKLNNDDKPKVGSGIGDWALLGTFFRINYIYDSKYLLEIDGRYDGTSRFQASNRYVLSPSGSLGWRISNENFFSPLKKIVSNLKLRLSYGKLPNQLLSSNYPYIATMPSGVTGYIFGDSQQPYVSVPGLVSSNFTWETVTTLNEGVDFGLIGNKLVGSFDYYTRKTKGMVVSGSPLPAILGTSAPSQNAANLSTYGFELELNWKDQLSNGLRYSIGINLSDSRTKITKYDLNPTGNIDDYFVGKQMGEIWGYKTLGLYQTDQEAQAVDNSKIWGGKWLAGDVHYADLNDDGEISPGKRTLSDHGDLKRIGNNLPRYQYGVRASIEYKGFDFAMLLQGTAKRDLMLGGPYFWGFVDEWSNPYKAQLDYWTPENTNAYWPRPRFSGGNQQSQTRYLQNGAYLRVKQLTLGYSLPNRLLKKYKVNSLRFYVTGQNLFVITNMIKTFDPEQPNRTQGVSADAYPLSRAISFGAQIGL